MTWTINYHLRENIFKQLHSGNTEMCVIYLLNALREVAKHRRCRMHSGRWNANKLQKLIKNFMTQNITVRSVCKNMSTYTCCKLRPILSILMLTHCLNTKSTILAPPMRIVTLLVCITHVTPVCSI